MKLFLLTVALFALALARPQNPTDAQAETRRFDNDIDIHKYLYGFETSNGIAADQTGELINPDTENEELVVSGRFTYPGPNGEVYLVTYTADKNGFRPEGAHLPK